MSKKLRNKFTDLIIRYSILLILSVFGLGIIYFIFEPLTKYPVFFLFNSLYDVYLSGNVINFRNYPIALEIIGACIAGSAYLLLLILNLSTPDIKLKNRMKIIFGGFITFLLFNIFRIFLIGMLFLNNLSWAELIHKFLWYFGSIALILIIWFYQVKKYNIKNIPFYSDIKLILSYINLNK
jgi:exosortase/archaeosortase family protein